MSISRPMYKENTRILKEYFKELEDTLKADVLVFYQTFIDGIEDDIKDIIESLKEDTIKNDILYVILTTNGGSITPVERIVNILRHHYKEVNIIVPNYAYSAGTIFAMSADKIFMNYHSVLGPIDPQVQNKDGKFVAALGYLDKIHELIEKAGKGSLTQAEFIILKDFDLAELRAYEQARDLAIDVLTKWLVQYKFKFWTTHTSNGAPVTNEDKEKRAKEIADKLSDNKVWKTHGRPLNREVLVEELKLKIEDLDSMIDFNKQLNRYVDYAKEYMAYNNYSGFIQTRRFI